MSKHLRLNPESPLAAGSSESQDSGLTISELEKMIAANASSDPEFAAKLREILDRKKQGS